MVGKFAKELTSRMLLLLSMMEAWMRSLNLLKLEMLSFQVKLIHVALFTRYSWFMDSEKNLFLQCNHFSPILIGLC